MPRFHSFFKFVFCCTFMSFGVTIAPSAAFAQQRFALVIGNSNYEEGPLKNPVNDARLMESTFKQLGFRVERVENATYQQMKKAIRDIGDQAKGAEVAVVFFAGHGMQAEGESYLIPIGAQVNKEADLDSEAVRASSVLTQMDSIRAKLGIVILDACSNNPFQSRTRSQTRGLGRMDPPNRTLLAYAAQPNAVADDGAGSNGLYTSYLAKYMLTKGREIRDVFNQTAIDVETVSKGKQAPREDGNLRNRFYLNGEPSQIAPLQAEPTAAPRPEPVPVGPAPAASQSQSGSSALSGEMVLIPSGVFTMGSAAVEADRRNEEGPQRQVRVERFELGKYEVTQGQWLAVMGNNPSNFKACGADCPVEQVSWDEVQGFIKRLNERTGLVYRLPSESEWEYGCRAGEQQRYCGSNEVDLVAWYDKNSSNKTQRVGQKRANAWGLHDMSGNVWEWTQDCWNDSYVNAPLTGAARTDGNCVRRVLRGGSWDDGARSVRAASRNDVGTAVRIIVFGFRLARTLP
jgi:formylglycine-generating enzyme required for sulfatase activity